MMLRTSYCDRKAMYKNCINSFDVLQADPSAMFRGIDVVARVICDGNP